MFAAIAQTGLPFIPSGADLRSLAAETGLTIGIVAVLFAALAWPRNNARAGVTALLALVASLIGLIACAPHASHPTMLLRGMLLTDAPAVLFKGLLLLFTIGVVLLWRSTTASAMRPGDASEFFVLLLGATLGMSLMASTSNLLLIVMAVEMASLPSYVLAGFRKTHRLGSEASLKYVLFGAACSAVMIYGTSLLYGLFGSLRLDEIAAALSKSGQTGGILFVFGIAGLIVGIGFKIAAVPFHFWCPDVFEGAGIDVTTFLSVASKGAGLMLLLRVVATLTGPLDPHSQFPIALAGVLGIMGATTATAGNLGALVQQNIKRLLAYSSIAHAGYMVCALSLLMGGASSVRAADAAQAILVYIAVYMVMNLGAFAVAGVVARATGSEGIDRFAALGRRHPILALSMAACLFSLIGLPPFAGFGAKLWLMKALAQSGGLWWGLVGVIALNAIISIYYYARIIRMMYLTESTETAPIAAAPMGVALAGACAVSLLGAFLFFSPLLELAGRFTRDWKQQTRAIDLGGNR